MTIARSLPRFALAIIARLAPADWRESVVGDLEEEREQRRRAGKYAGWLWAIAASAAVSFHLHREQRRSLIMPAARARAFDNLWPDVQQAIASLRRSRVYALAAIVTMALGIGANASVFTLAHWLLLRQVPGVARPSELVNLSFELGDRARIPMSLADFRSLRAGVPAFSNISGYGNFPLHIAVPNGAARRINAEVVADSYFDVLGNGVIGAGRAFTADEYMNADAPSTVVISRELGQSDFGGAANALGKTLLVNGQPFTVVGVAVPGFRGATLSGGIDVWVSFAQHRSVMPQYSSKIFTDRRTTVLSSVVGRLAPGESIDDARAQTAGVKTQLVRAEPSDRTLARGKFLVLAGTESRPWVVDTLRKTLSLLMGFVSLLLLLTCANVANLMFARGSGRRSEIATRLAMGASRWRVIRLLLIESVVLSIGACLGAIGFAQVVSKLFEGVNLVPSLAPLERIDTGWLVFAFGAAVSVMVAAVSAVLPAVAASRVNIVGALRDGGRSHTSSRTRVRSVLTSLQVAVSVTLLIGAALLARSMNARLSINTGFDASRVLSFSVNPGLQAASNASSDAAARQQAFYQRLLDRIREVPGVRSAGLAWLQPFSFNAASTSFKLEGETQHDEINADSNMVSTGFFDALGLPITAGRDFNEQEIGHEDTNGGGVAIVSEGLATRAFGSPQAAVGRRVVMSYPKGRVRTIIGVARDAKQRRVISDEGLDTFYQPFGQSFSSSWASVQIGLLDSDTAVIPRIHAAVASIDPSLPVYDVTRLDRAILKQFADNLLVSRLAAAFGILAAALAAVGLYGVLARGVVERKREFGIRTALGARPGAIAALVTSEALRMTLVGALLGCGAAFWLERFIHSRLYGITRTDPIAIAGTLIFVIACTLAASLIPARRASHINVVSELR